MSDTGEYVKEKEDVGFEGLYVAERKKQCLLTDSINAVYRQQPLMPAGNNFKDVSRREADIGRVVELTAWRNRWRG